mgnify:CR=1 FL=1
MCIRDRGTRRAGELLDACFGQNLQCLLAQDQPNVEIGLVGRWVTDFGSGDVEEGRQLAQGVTLISVGPVSYTHLRAHETVLDLVCRLLLEKKKKESTKKQKKKKQTKKQHTQISNNISDQYTR